MKVLGEGWRNRRENDRKQRGAVMFSDVLQYSPSTFDPKVSKCWMKITFGTKMFCCLLTENKQTFVVYLILADFSHVISFLFLT